MKQEIQHLKRHTEKLEIQNQILQINMGRIQSERESSSQVVIYLIYMEVN